MEIDTNCATDWQEICYYKEKLTTIDRDHIPKQPLLQMLASFNYSESPQIPSSHYHINLN